jgi:hypothetical protein
VASLTVGDLADDLCPPRVAHALRQDRVHGPGFDLTAPRLEQPGHRFVGSDG